MEKQDFYTRFTDLLDNLRDRHELKNRHDALILWFAENVLAIDPEDVKERIIEDKFAEGVDSLLLDQDDFKQFFLQAEGVETFKNTEANFSETKIKSTLQGVSLLLKGDYKGKISPELENLTDEYHENDKTGNYSSHVIFIILKKPPVDDKFVKLFQKDNPEVKVEFWDFERILSFYRDTYLLLRAAPPAKISFDVLHNTLSKNDPNKSRVFTCKGSDLAKVYNLHRETIFQQNIRYPLGIREKSINGQILSTASNADESKNFWYFNNGITIICKKIQEATSGRIIILEEAQIINGAQTTYALYEAYRLGKLADNIEVLVKVIETDDRNFIEQVTLSTNSQNAIRLRDLCSKDDIQLAIRSIINGSYHYYYESKRGEFELLYPTPEAKKKILGDHYQGKIIDNENAAQALLGFYLGKPSQSKAEKRRIFMKDGGLYSDIFNAKDKILAEKILLSWRLLKLILRKKDEYKREYKTAEDLKEKEQLTVYRYDFIFHSEYFILNILKDFIVNDGFNIDAKKADIDAVLSALDGGAEKLLCHYDVVVENLAEFIDIHKKAPNYYHNKFFKNEKSIGLIREAFNKKLPFVSAI